jgi:uncharacterized protein (TIGR03435 family)
MNLSLALTQSMIVVSVILSIALTFAFDEPARQIGEPRFDSATISPSASEGRSNIRLLPKGELIATSATLRELILFAHRRDPFHRLELVGAPDWASTDRFDVKAVIASGHEFDVEGSPRKTFAMLRNLLTERFQLKIRQDTRNQPVYLLTLAAPNGTLGPKLRRSDVDCGAVMRGERPAMVPGQGPTCSFKTPPGRLFASAFSIQTIAHLMSDHLGRPVVDGTGLQGLFDLELEAVEIKAESNHKPGPSDLALPPPPGTSIFVAVREQLGLRLEPQDAPVPVVVIEQARRLGQ